jgi:hypothetical protein
LAMHVVLCVRCAFMGKAVDRKTISSLNPYSRGAKESRCNRVAARSYMIRD